MVRNLQVLAGTNMLWLNALPSFFPQKKESIRMGLEMRVDAVSNYTEGCLYFARR